MTDSLLLRKQLVRLELRHPVATRKPTGADIEMLKKAGRWPISDCVEMLLLEFGGSRPPAGKRFTSGRYDLADFLGFGAPGQRDVSSVTFAMKSRIPKPWLPWARDGMGNYFIVLPDGERVGVWDHERHDGNRVKVEDLNCDLNGFFETLIVVTEE